MSTTRRSWDAARATRKAKASRRDFPVEVPPATPKAAYRAKRGARPWPGAKQTIGALQAHYEAVYGRAPITLPKVSILKDDQ